MIRKQQPEQQRRKAEAEQAERTEFRRQVRGLLLLAFAVLVFTMVRAARHNGLGPGWWRLW